MTTIRNLQRSFTGGELTPEFFGKIDDAKYALGLAKCRNFVVKPQGPVENRAGFQFIREVKDSTKKTRLIPFTYSTTQTMVLEMGAGYFRFHTAGGTVLSGGVPYEVANPYAEEDLFDVHYVQSADVLTLAHPKYAVRELRRQGATNWLLSTVSFTPSVSAPASVTGAGQGFTAAKYSYFYVVTAVAANGVEESSASVQATGASATITGVTQASPGVITTSAAHNLAVGDPVTIAGVVGMTQLNGNSYTAASVPTATTLTLKDSTGTAVNTTTFGAYTSGGTLTPGCIRSNLFETGCTNTITWATVAGAARYNVYKQQGGLYGYIGHTSGTSLIDDNIAPDLSKTPPIYEDPFADASAITSVDVISGGSGYSTSTSGGAFTAASLLDTHMTVYGTASVTVTDPTGTGAVLELTTSLWAGLRRITGIRIVSAGSGYTNPTITIYDGSTPKSSTAVGYSLSPIVTTGPTITVSDSTGSGAVLRAVLTGDAITAVEVINGGYGYSAPTFSVTAPTGSGAEIDNAVLSSFGANPGAVSYFEQRRCFAGTTNKPQNIWMTKSGTESNMSYSLPIRDDDRIAFRVAAREANTIRHIVPLSHLLLLTSSAEWRVTSVNSDAITPSTISVRPQSYVGASNAQPAIINNSLIYGAARGGHVYELGYSWQANGFVTGDLSIRAPHLFDGFGIVDMAYCKAPTPVVWFVSTSGKLLGLTYVPEHQIGAWHQHDTDGVFESCTTVAEGKEDVLYVVIRREINGATKRYVERLASRQFVDQGDAFFVDCGATYNGAPADVISGLDHLEGKTVAVLADGAVHPQRTVTGGQITLDQEASKVHVGLPIEADLQTLPLAFQIDGGFGQGRTKNVNRAWLRVYRSSGLFVGPSAEDLTEAKQRTNEPYGTPPSLKNEEIEVRISPTWSDGGQVFVRQADPLPLTIASLTLEVAVGG